MSIAALFRKRRFLPLMKTIEALTWYPILAKALTLVFVGQVNEGRIWVRKEKIGIRERKG